MLPSICNNYCALLSGCSFQTISWHMNDPFQGHPKSSSEHGSSWRQSTSNQVFNLQETLSIKISSLWSCSFSRAVTINSPLRHFPGFYRSVYIGKKITASHSFAGALFCPSLSLSLSTNSYGCASTGFFNLPRKINHASNETVIRQIRES